MLHFAQATTAVLNLHAKYLLVFFPMTKHTLTRLLVYTRKVYMHMIF
jgi:hypothetical protein